MKAIRLLVPLLLPLLAAAQTPVHGTIEQTDRWAGEVLLDGDILVARGATLVIAPGTRIRILPHADRYNLGQDPERIEIVVLGRLLAQGRAESPIPFQSAAQRPGRDQWFGLVMKDRGDESLIEHAVIEHGYKGITCYGSSPRIAFTTVRNHFYAGISAEVKAAPRISDSEITGNDFAGLLCELGAAPVVERTRIAANGAGVITFDRSVPDLGRRYPEPGQSVGENEIYGNREAAIRNQSAMEIHAQNNRWAEPRYSRIRERIVDRDDNPRYGNVIFEPVYRVSTPSAPVFTPPDSLVQPPAIAALTDSGAAADSDTPATVFDRATPPPDTAGFVAAGRLNAFQSVQKPVTPRADTPPETVIVYRDPEPAPPAVVEPVTEDQLDSGRRRYQSIARPRYPEMYRRAGREGSVTMQVVVGRDGRVQSWMVLRSDGELFTEAAEAAVARMRYEPETVQGQPVRFKIYESFIFRLRQEE